MSEDSSENDLPSATATEPERASAAKKTRKTSARKTARKTAKAPPAPAPEAPADPPEPSSRAPEPGAPPADPKADSPKPAAALPGPEGAAEDGGGGSTPDDPPAGGGRSSARGADAGQSGKPGGQSGRQGGGGRPQQPAGGGFASRKKKKRKGGKFDKSAGGGGGGGGGGPRRGSPFNAGGVPVEVDPHLEMGQLADDELLQDVSALEESFRRLFDEDLPPVRFNDFYELPLQELRERARAMDLDFENAPSRPLLLRELLRHFESKSVPVLVEGCLEVLDEGFGMVTFPCDSYQLKSLCPFVSEALVEHHGMERGHTVEVLVQAPREGESCPVVLRVRSVMGGEIAALEKITPFTELVPYYPLERILLENSDEAAENNLSMRVVDLISPIGFGQRGLIVAPPRTGKTVLLQGIAHSVQLNYPDAHLIVLLIDERPEEVTDFRRRVKGEVISSTFDETAGSHVHAAEMVIEKARRMVEVGRDVVILLDSITRLARAYNTLMPNSGKILSGGVEANALQKPKRFFGSARNIEEGGSLTIMGTALVDTGSKMDEVIFEEFKGTGNMELHLDRALVDKRIFPALAMDRSGTRKEELLYHPDEMMKVYSLRRATKGVPPVEAMEMLIQRVKKTRSNAEFLMTLSR
ncbi:MAG: transcription termination factor Rho [Puniceicoccaceae bacterium]